MSRKRIRIFSLLAIVLSLWLSTATLPVRTRASSSSESFIPGEVLVKLSRASDLTAVAADYSLDPTPINQFGSRPIYRLRISDGASARDKAAALIADPLGRVVYADPNFVHQAPEGRARVIYAGGFGDGDYRGQYAPARIRLPEAHTITRGAGITVAVLDTGVDFAHPALAGRLLPGYDFVDGDTNPSEEGVYGQNAEFGHGTHVAGLIALVAPDAKIRPIRVLNPDGAGNVWVLAEALAFAMDPDGNPATSDGANVINLSLSTLEKSRLLRDVIRAATCDETQHQSPDDLPCFSPIGEGAVVVAAAGNNASSNPEYPAGEGIKGALAVGASTQNDTLAEFSNFGSWVNVAAPGQGILSSVPGGDFGSWSGTSMATPLVAGEAALVRAAFPSLKARDVTRRIIDNSKDIRARVRFRIDAAAALGLTPAH
ncbi:MAG TPA: S8 family serine peptidase [Blastocatellia bacterium]|nr:S8 family serine peptidase [Blastocatellia bacterium]